MIISPSISAGFVNSYKSFPYLPRDIRDNNSIAPDHEFINLPTNNSSAYWTEQPPFNWSQYAPDYNVFLKYYLKADGSDENVPDGGGRIHALKAASFGSSLGVSPKARNVTSNTISTSLEDKDWSLSQISYTVPITTQTHVNFGCFYKVLEQDLLRSLNFGGIALYFTKGSSKSYLNYSIIHGGLAAPLGNNSTYTYLNTYDGSKTYEAYNQWLGEPIIKFKKLDQIRLKYEGFLTPSEIPFAGQPITALLNQWKFLNYQVEIPTFVNSPENDGVTGKADSCTMMLFFGENNSYLDDGSGLNTGAIQFLYPFLSLS